MVVQCRYRRIVFYNTLSWFVSELPEKDISNVVVQCRRYSTISCRDLWANFLGNLALGGGDFQGGGKFPVTPAYIYMCMSVSFKERGKLMKYITFIF